MALAQWTADRVIAISPKVYHTNHGNSYKAVPLYDENGVFHGHAIYILRNDIENEKPDLVKFYPRRQRDRPV